MKRFTNILLRLLIAALLPLGALSCNGPKTIPDEELINIFHDAFLTNAYLDVSRTQADSLHIYEPIFKRYGYTREDVQHTIQTFSERKSAMLSDIMVAVSERLDEESKAEAYKVMILDTIDRIAQRIFTRTMLSDTLIQAKRLEDTTKLRIWVNDLVPGEYNVSFDYLVDSLDENRNSRIEVYLMRSDSSQVMRHTTMMSRRRMSKYSRKFSVDTSHKSLYINMYYHPRNEESKLPDVTITNFEVVRVLPADVAVDSLYFKQLDTRIFNHRLMTSFTADSVRHSTATPKNDTINEPKDSLTLRSR